jgi:hypothetical protein
MIHLYPEALNQQPFSLVDEARVLLFWSPVALFAFICAISATLVYHLRVKSLSRRTAFKASLIIGAAIFALIPLYQLPFFLLRPGNPAAITGICLAVLVLVLAIRAAVLLVRRSPPEL